MVQIIPERALAARIARMPAVQAEVKSAAQRIAVTATALLEPHRKSGRTHIDLSRIRADPYGRYDWFVSLVAPGGDALAIEFGHAESGRFANVPGSVEGLYILTRALAAHSVA